MALLQAFPIPSVIAEPLHTAYEVGGYLYYNERYARDGRHYGIDLGARSGAKIVSMFGGKLCEFDLGDAYGLQVAEYKRVDDRWIIWKHAHCSSVTGDDLVAVGHMIAKVGATGQTFGAHDHLERYAVPVARFNGSPRVWPSAARIEVWRSFHTNPRPALAEVRARLPAA